MEKSNIKRDNRKALPKYLLVLLAAGLAGGVLGVASGYAGRHDSLSGLLAALDGFLAAVVPWGIPATSVILLGAGWWKYREAKGIHSAWDGEDEAVIDVAEGKLNYTLLLTTVQLLLNFFFFSARFYYHGFALESTLLFMGSFLLSIAAIVALQQKVVDLTRRINPEKQGSVYDLNFKKKWFESCDEAEQRWIGQAAYKSYSVLNVACPVIWGVLMFLSFILDIGLLPCFVVMLVWGVLNITYILECMRLQKRRG